ncbi:MAG: hypothetical protein IIY07_02635, partial [Thermoguttaceae bacterium]|nr:hypothetical protein [Thermoguttaceae bacterium]
PELREPVRELREPPVPGRELREPGRARREAPERLAARGRRKRGRTPAPSEPIKIDFDPERSYSRLLYPGVAARVGLTDMQTARVNELMIERSQKLAQADKSQWNAITAASEEALKAVLTAEQVERFERGVSEKTITLRFNKERWEDVLKWLASEVGLQLVMSAPPQGTFTYNDSTPYQPKDALDIVNGRLNFQGYTLFRYNEMLILHDFRTGSLPLQYMPKITPEDLPNQNRFDYVALTIPLERRSMSAVRQTIAPFQGPYCFLRSQGGNSLLVVDSVNALREIYAAAMSVHNPDPPPAPPQHPRGPGRAPEVPEWREFPLEGVAYNTVKAQIDVFAPEAKSLYNPQANVLHYLARPSQLNIIGGLIDRLKQGADPAKNAIAKVYPLDRLAAASASDIWAFSRRMRGGSFGAPTQSTLYTQIVDALQQIAPDAQIELNAESRKIFVIGTAAEHEKIAATFASLTTEVAPEEAPVVKVYRFQNQRSSAGLDPAIMQALRTVAPFAQPTPTTDGGLLVVATQAEHEIVAKTLADFEASAEAPEFQRELKVYRLTTRQVARFTQIYSQLSSSADMRGAVRVSDSTAPNRVVFWARPAQHAKIAKIIDEIVAAESYVDAKTEPTPQGLPAAQDPAAPAPAPAPAAPAEPTPEQK